MKIDYADCTLSQRSDDERMCLISGVRSMFSLRYLYLIASALHASLFPSRELAIFK